MSEENHKDGPEQEWSGFSQEAPPPLAPSGENLIKWSDDLSVGNPLLDGQHKRLISMINTLGRKSLSVDELGEVIFGLLEYAAVHFRDEEVYIKEMAPDIVAEHFESHTAFISTAYRFVNRFKRGEALELRDPVYEFLCDWLIHHIREEDSQYNRPHPAA
ncbi:MAG TPA: bacteriohemerythrin [Candidatus Sulfotelmatobacter sp.]|jgi:hemerythrin-like metal-binding protein|nr:bacteriohemerythrin [Candidatus Sulfotelmatobacter sp.]